VCNTLCVPISVCHAFLAMPFVAICSYNGCAYSPVPTADFSEHPVPGVFLAMRLLGIERTQDEPKADSQHNYWRVDHDTVSVISQLDEGVRCGWRRCGAAQTPWLTTCGLPA